MRHKRGKGEIMVFDEQFIIHLEKMRKEKGYYPSLREIGESFDLMPPSTSETRPDRDKWNYARRAIERLAAAGKLSDEAMTVYATTHKENKKNEKGNKKSTVKKASAKGKR
ncbi:MAG TPA: hypothetical protein PKL77_09655 [Candidatus Omnitrophota bacterium]|nr:hypothetical protein [Candidatus Omnitrophota bacterium]